MVVPGGVEGEVAQDVAGGGVDDGDVVVVGQDEDAGSVVVASDSDVVQAAVDAQGDGSGLVDAVGAYSVVGVESSCGVGFGAAGVDDCGGGSVWQ